MSIFTIPRAASRGRLTSPLVVRPLLKLLALRRQRRALGDLDDHILHDIGLSRHDADIESRKPIWDVPAHWRA